jgi:hypothetical protein
MPLQQPPWDSARVAVLIGERLLFVQQFAGILSMGQFDLSANRDLGSYGIAGEMPLLDALPDGRLALVQGHSGDRTVGGSLRLLSAPYDKLGPALRLPLRFDPYAIASDQRFLYLAGSGGQIFRISVDSLP